MLYDEQNQLIVEKEDQCWTCKHNPEYVTIKDSKLIGACPLLETLYLGVTFFPIDDAFVVKGCGLYNDRRHLKVVKND